ncbi:hypothetical protein DKG71_34915 [Streptomyces sp. NEAU-S7GS2]|nr:hypothetical protein DKG71_34915 [Streptomyces sp. NEAU-S7GS2]
MAGGGSGAHAEEQDILGHLHGKLAKYKIPKSVILTDSLPRTATGKNRQIRRACLLYGRSRGRPPPVKPLPRAVPSAA